jgi:hypothetical protein
MQQKWRHGNQHINTSSTTLGREGCRANIKLFELSTQVAEASRKLTLLFKLL